MNKTMKIILENQLCANTEVHFFIKPGFDTNFNNVTIWTNIDHNNVTVWTNNDHNNNRMSVWTNNDHNNNRMDK